MDRTGADTRTVVVTGLPAAIAPSALVTPYAPLVRTVPSGKDSDTVTAKVTVRLLPAPTARPVHWTSSPTKLPPSSTQANSVSPGTVSVMVTPLAAALPTLSTTRV